MKSVKCILVLSVVSLLLVGPTSQAQKQPDSGENLDPLFLANDRLKEGGDPNKQIVLGVDFIQRAESNANLKEGPSENAPKERLSFVNVCDYELMAKINAEKAIDRFWVGLYVNEEMAKSKSSGGKTDTLTIQNEEVKFIATQTRIVAYSTELKKFSYMGLAFLGTNFLPYRMHTIINRVYKELGVTTQSYTAPAGLDAKIGTQPNFFSKVENHSLRISEFPSASSVLKLELGYLEPTQFFVPANTSAPSKFTRTFPTHVKPADVTELTKMYGEFNTAVGLSHSNICKQLTTVVMIALGHKAFRETQTKALIDKYTLAQGRAPNENMNNIFTIAEGLLKEFYWSIDSLRPADCVVENAKTLRAAVSLSLIGENIEDTPNFTSFEFFKPAFFRSVSAAQAHLDIISYDQAILVGVGKTNLASLIKLYQNKFPFHIHFFEYFNLKISWMSENGEPNKLTKLKNDQINVELLRASLSPTTKDYDINSFILHTYILLYKVYVKLRASGAIKMESDLKEVWKQMFMWFAGDNVDVDFSLQGEIFKDGFFTFVELQMYYPAAVSYLCLMVGTECVETADKFAIPAVKATEKETVESLKTARNTASKEPYARNIANVILAFETLKPQNVARSFYVNRDIFVLDLYKGWKKSKKQAEDLVSFYWALITLDINYNAFLMPDPKGDPKTAKMVPRTGAPKVDELNGWFAGVSTCAKVGVNGKILPTNPATEPFKFVLTLACTKTLYDKYVAIIEKYLGDSALKLSEEKTAKETPAEKKGKAEEENEKLFVSFFKQLEAVMSLTIDFNLRSVLAYLTLLYIRGYDANRPPGQAAPKIRASFVKYFVDFYATTKVKTLDATKSAGFYFFLVQLFGDQTKPNNPASLYLFRLTEREAESFLLDIYTLLHRAIQNPLGDSKIKTQMEKLLKINVERFGTYALKSLSAKNNKFKTWTEYAASMDLIFKTESTVAAKPEDVKNQLPSYLKIANHLASMHIFSATVDFYEYFSPFSKRIEGRMTNPDLKLLLVAFSTYYHFNLRLRHNYDSDARLVHGYVLEKLEICLNFLAGKTEVLDAAKSPENDYCDLSYRKYAEIYSLYKMYLIVDKSFKDVTLANFHAEVPLVRVGTFFYFAVNDKRYEQELNAICGKKNTLEICDVWLLFRTNVQAFQSQGADVEPSEEFLLQLKTSFNINSGTDKAPFIRLKKLLLTFTEAVYVASHKSPTAMDALFRDALIDLPEDELKVYIADGVIPSIAFEITTMKGDPAEVSFIANYLQYNYRKRKIEEKEKATKTIVQALLLASKDKAKSPKTDELTLANFMSLGGQKAIGILKIFLMYCDSLEEFKIVAEYVTSQASYLKIVSLDDDFEENYIHAIIANMNRIVTAKSANLQEYLKKPENLKALMSAFHREIEQALLAPLEYVKAVMEVRIGVTDQSPKSDAGQKSISAFEGAEYLVTKEIVKHDVELEKTISNSVINLSTTVTDKNIQPQLSEDIFVVETLEVSKKTVEVSKTTVTEETLTEESHQMLINEDTCEILQEIEKDLEEAGHEVNVSKVLQTEKFEEVLEPVLKTTTVEQEDNEGSNLEAIDKVEEEVQQLAEEFEQGELLDDKLQEADEKQTEEEVIIEQGLERRLRRVRRTLRIWMPRAALSKRRVRI
jgi:hypothetical protein